ncbi:MAG: TetR/AcrR family transcriptional regulator [Vicinamibacterales bacterium]
MGRPRSASAHARVLDAAGRLFAEHGIDATSMDAIAEASGVSKATIYKHWPDKGALCLEVMSSLHDVEPAPAFQPSGDVRTDLVAFLGRQPPKPRTELRSRLMPHLMAYAVRNPAFGQAWRQQAIDPPRLQVIALLKQAIADGRLSPEIDLEAQAVGLVGPMMYRTMLRLTGGQPFDHLAQVVVSTLWQAYGRPARRVASRKR